jgi:HlyD family secretion protein
LVSAQAKLDSLLAGPSDTELRQAQIAVETAQLKLDAAKQALDDAAIIAPFDGLVAAVNIEVGEMPSAGGAIALIDTSRYTTTLSIDEKDIAQLQVGQSVNLNVQAFSGTTSVGTVTQIEPAPKSSSGLVTYNVEITLNSADANLRPGMTTVANVVLSHQDNVIVVPNRFITTDEATGTSTVKVQTAPGTYTDVAVTLGAQSDTESVITGGVSVGVPPGAGGSAPPSGAGGGGGFPGG